jgi:hypothetical protein
MRCDTSHRLQFLLVPATVRRNKEGIFERCQGISSAKSRLDVSPDRYDTMLGKPFRTRSAHIVTLWPIRVAGRRDKLDASFLDAKHALSERRYR